MPPFPGNGLAAPLAYNRQAHLWLNESVPVNTYPGSLSTAFQLQRIDGGYYPWGVSFEVYFSGNPGAFEIDILGSGVDQAQNYSQIGMITVANSYVSGYYVGRWDMPSNIWVRYVAAYMKNLANSVNTWLLVTR